MPYFRNTLHLLADPLFTDRIRPSVQLDKIRAQYHFEAANSLSEIPGAEGSGEAEQLYRTAVSLAPTEYAYNNRLAFNLVKKRAYDDALVYFQACFLLRPTKADMVNNIGNIYMARARIEEALRAYKLGQRLDPADGDGLYNMGALLLRFPDRAQEAVVALRAAHRLLPSDTQVGKAFEYARTEYARTLVRDTKPTGPQAERERAHARAALPPATPQAARAKKKSAGKKRKSKG
eukprot:Tamp_14169.p2 GENE.Tamp_14169~~Tamp_14169.p2  ORF type:complete len:234 (-),score=29.42 Tamp_14169:6-707(-)